MKVRGLCNIKIRVGTYKALFREYHHDDILQGLFVGIIIVFLLYNLFIYFQLKDPVYLLYTLYLACGSGFVFRHNGYIFEFMFSTTPQYNDFAMILSGFGGMMGTLFTMRFLRTGENLPKLHRVFQLLFVLYSVDLAASIFNFPALSVFLSRYITALGTLTVAFAAITMWWRGDNSAKYYLLGWICLTIGLVVFILEDSCVLPFNKFTAYAVHLGFGLEAIILSFAVANRFRTMKVDKEDALQKMYDALADNKLLVDERNKALEERVEERTQKLESALEKVNESEEKLQAYAVQLEKSNKELTDFAHIASHDLKAPIRSIISFSQLYERRNKDKFDEIDREYFDYIKNNAHNSARLIDDLLNYSKIDKNLGAPSEVDLNNSVVLSMMNLQSTLQERNAEIIYQNLPILRGHASLFTQLFQNFISNGIKYNQSSRPIVEIKAQIIEGKDTVYSIKDNGIGIAPQNQKDVFDMFKRLHGQGEYEGTGIGLAFCTRIVETYGGKIWLESEVGKGTTFFFTLPKATIVESETFKLVTV